MRYKVPQNIDMQDRIIGPLTMVQLIYAVIGGGAAYSVVMTFHGTFGYILAAPLAIFTLALIFMKINERPFLDFFLSMAQFLSAPKQRVWHHQSYDNLKVVIYKTKKVERKIEEKHISHEKIHEVASKLDSPK